jgi:hypothetical protein
LKRGITLTEILVVVAILSCAIIPGISMFQFASGGIARSGNHLIAVSIARTLVERVMFEKYSYDFNVPFETSGKIDVANVLPASLPPAETRRYKNFSYSIKEDKLDTDGNLLNLTATVYYLESGTEMTYTISTMLANYSPRSVLY